MIGWTATATAAIWQTATCRRHAISSCRDVACYVSAGVPMNLARAVLPAETLQATSLQLRPRSGSFMTDQFTLADSAAQLILQRTSLRPQIGLVLGSGLGGFADSLTDATRVPYADIPAFPRSTAIGHAGQMVLGHSGTVPVAAMQGRVHLYEDRKSTR